MENKSINLDKLVEHYYEYLIGQLYSNKTLRNYMSCIHKFIDFKNNQYSKEIMLNSEEVSNLLQSYRAELIKTYSNEHSANSHTLNAHTSALRGLFNYANDRNYLNIQLNSVAKYYKNDTGKKREILKPNDIQKISDILIEDIRNANEANRYLYERNRALFYTYLYTGARVAEGALT
ncbi:phage integrase family protein with SAM-like domain [Natranaerovirga pectinivora]|uniref:Phage integrase family protein with SAM-like domain n=1 Tax=Natranaerovirga pectinivora TaxID=682400 RepID=A0A4R3MTV2_9FIRM|nr:site-specific integrase [Natranaerovirga pectinivora]TCT17150.1 phage integrase family protein with SAM-like domain [Natranaerovirga pectinivora]